MTAQQSLFRSVASILVRRPPILGSIQTTIDHDIHSLIRHPNASVYLIVKKPRKHNAWQFPQGGIDPGESVLQGALRELEEECGSDIKVKPVETSPSCYYQYEFPQAFIAKQKRKHIGAKVQFIRSDWLSGQCQPDGEEIIDYAWLMESELKDYVTPEYQNAIQSLFTYPSTHTIV
ncbi:NUDIX hydrolase domain-like protein [Chlamydoabsidia padenii]|nr:NUDIX hydrolase domain-like protein [Chlamydoabsidia padenii]